MKPQAPYPTEGSCLPMWVLIALLNVLVLVAAFLFCDGAR